MKLQQTLSHVWGVWLSLSSGSKDAASYQSNLVKLHQLSTWADFAYIWGHSDIKDPKNYFADPASGVYHKVQIKGSLRKVESINFFKGDIEPTWEYGDNSKGGYFNFAFSKEVPCSKTQQAYQLLVLMSLGETLDICPHVRGVRIVDTLAKRKFRCRFEIWVDYQEADQNLDMIKKHAEEIRDLLKGVDILLTDMRFLNIGAKIEQAEKIAKDADQDRK